MDNEEKKELLAKSEVSLQLDTYDDIFSDFDPRPYSHRALSFDFLEEARRATREYKESVQLSFIIPNSKRDQKVEEVIKKRLKEHFKKHSMIKTDEKKSILLKGVGMIFLGLVFMFLGAYISYYMQQEFWIHFLKVVFEVGGWFSVWSGMDQALFGFKRIEPEYQFNSKLMKADIIFNSY